MNSKEQSRRSGPIQEIARQINDALSQVQDKNWNYSRIRLESRGLRTLESPYALWIEHVNPETKTGKAELKQLQSEITWGNRHSDELGILEIVSLRLNKALLEFTSDQVWSGNRPVVRVMKKQALETQGITNAFWYKIEEVAGEDFENR